MSETSPSEVLDVLDADATTEKRATWEAFEFTVLESGAVKVVNASHDNPDDHQYTVHTGGRIPTDCTCPAFEYQKGPCKHMVAVAIREPVLEAATAKPVLKADGGVVVERRATDERPDDCDCAPSFDGLPCWACYRDGFEVPNPDARADE